MTYETFETLEVTQSGHLALVTIAREAQRNALSSKVIAELLQVAGELEISKVWIAAVNGFALGGGTEIALACDFIYAAETAKFGQPEVTLGVIPGFGGTQRLARRVGVAKAKELCMTGDIIDAAEALRIGLADKVVPAAELMAAVTAIAGRIAANGPHAVSECKRLVHQGQSMSLAAALVLEQKSFGLCFATTDQREGMSAFLAKPRRKPLFTGK
jgi:enoyl-CoA hydratase